MKPLTIDEMQWRVRQLLKLIGDEGTCKSCGAPIYWVKHKGGKCAPYTPSGLNHFADCPHAEQHRKQK